MNKKIICKNCGTAVYKENRSIKHMTVEEIIVEFEKSEINYRLEKLNDCVGLIIILLCIYAIMILTILLQ